MASQPVSGGAQHPGFFAGVFDRQLSHYPDTGARRMHLLLVVAITVALYYELYVGGGVATLILGQLQMPFGYFVTILALGNLIGAFASLLAGLSDRFGRANLVVYGLLIVGLITLFGVPNAHTKFVYGIEYGAVAFVEGIILVATPALIRDFSPQVGRATAMAFWTIGPVLGSLIVSLVTTYSLPIYQTWQSQYVICGIIGLVVFLVAFFFLRELAPALRDQLMVSERDRVLIEAKAKGLDIEASLRNPWGQMMHLDIIGSAFGVSVLLFFYYTAVAFGTIYLVTVFGFSIAKANSLANWSWGTNAIALVVGGVLSDKLRVRKPFMLLGGLGGAVMIILFLQQAGQHPPFSTLVLLSCGQSIFIAFAYATWMASFTETVEARNPALTATGLAIWGWLLRMVVTACFFCLPLVIKSVNPLITASYYLAAYHQALAAHTTPPPALLAQLGVIQAAAAAAPGEWRTWYWICVAGIVIFLASIFIMRGRWSPQAAKADELAHDAAVQRELALLSGR
ncbi:MAG TPA: MFS transporter [Acetobacteraceae bacterium]|nr:MFS transporter [Acetobacteraceae bacterium]